jgi:hypothetical protein
MSRTTCLAACFALVVAGGGCQASVAGGPPDLAPAFRSGIVFSASEAGLESGTLGDAFDFYLLRDLWVRVTLPGMPRVGALTLIFLNPRGNVFHVDGPRFSLEPMMKEIEVPGVEHKLPVFAAKLVPGGYALDYPVAIGGTSFQRFPLREGIWEVRAMMEGVPGVLTTTLKVNPGR